tara:strand:+ start:73 stop:387 length:315 start_codon:yes stop_codon:yes gene_type:complete
MIHITKDHFVWLDVTDRMKYGCKWREEIWMGFELFSVDDDDSESLLESHEDIDKALESGLRICIEVDHLPSQYHPKQTWKDTDKKLIDGYWYVKMADINLQESK